MEKIPFDIDAALGAVKAAVQPFAPAALFQLADEGFSSPFEQLIACIISIRTYDEMTVKLAHNLFEQARSPSEILALSAAEIDHLIYASSFHERKAGQIRAIAQRVMDEFDGELPCDEDVLLSFDGVGVKCAHLALGIACGQAWISVDVHVHRVTNRWGYVHTRSPEKTMEALQDQLPKKYWIEINRLLVPFGKHICTGTRPFCSKCPVLPMCQQVGVENPR